MNPMTQNEQGAATLLPSQRGDANEAINLTAIIINVKALDKVTNK